MSNDAAGIDALPVAPLQNAPSCLTSASSGFFFSANWSVYDRPLHPRSATPTRSPMASGRVSSSSLSRPTADGVCSIPPRKARRSVG